MSFNPSSPVTGAALTGVITSPTFTLTSDGTSGQTRGFYVSALGGTQTGVLTHSVSDPFQAMWALPKSFMQLQAVNPTTGLLERVPMNVHTFSTRKGVSPLAGQPRIPAVARTQILVPAGSELADPVALASLLSLHWGIGFANALGMHDTLRTGVT